MAREFQVERVNGKLPLMWKEIVKKFDVQLTDPLLEQSLYQEVFEVCLKECFALTGHQSTSSVDEVALSGEELNILRCVSGYVARTTIEAL